MIPLEARLLIEDNAELEISFAVWFGERRHLVGVRARHRPARAATPTPGACFVGNLPCKRRVDIQRSAHETMRPTWI